MDFGSHDERVLLTQQIWFPRKLPGYKFLSCAPPPPPHTPSEMHLSLLGRHLNQFILDHMEGRHWFRGAIGGGMQEAMEMSSRSSVLPRPGTCPTQVLITQTSHPCSSCERCSIHERSWVAAGSKAINMPIQAPWPQHPSSKAWLEELRERGNRRVISSFVLSLLG